MAPWRLNRQQKISSLLKATPLRRNLVLGVGTLKQELADLLQPAAVNCFGQGAVENLAKHTRGQPDGSAIRKQSTMRSGVRETGRD